MADSRHAQGQQSTLPVIGLLGTESLDVNVDWLRAFRQTLSEAGYVDGRNVTIEYHSAQGQGERLPGLVADLVAVRWRSSLRQAANPRSPPRQGRKRFRSCFRLVQTRLNSAWLPA